MNTNPAIFKQKCFHPPYCPNEDCLQHTSQPLSRWYRSKGWAKTQGFPYQVRCFQCRLCKRSFRYTFFKLSYRDKRYGLSSKIFRFFTCGVSNREIARQLRCSEHLVRIKLKKLAQWSLLRHSEMLHTLTIEEPIVYDGLENFAKSQYDPNHIQQAIGKDSLFIYDFGFAPLNRKGRMSDRQKRVRAELEMNEGRYHPKAIRTSTQAVFERLYKKRGDLTKPLIIYSDEHFQYERVVTRDLKQCQIQHIQISSRQSRNYKNHLFAVNHTDLLIRQHVGAFSRETICFSKTHESMIQKYILFSAYKNYFRPQYVKPHKRRPTANIHTPAMELGVARSPFSFSEFFNIKRSLKQVSLNPEWSSYYHETPTYKRNSIKIAA